MTLASLMALGCEETAHEQSEAGGTHDDAMVDLAPNSTGPDAAPTPDTAAAGPDANDRTFCWNAVAGGLAPDARACAVDSDCTFVEVATCCGYWVPGIATLQQSKYSTCLSRQTCSPNYDCFAFPYQTDACQVDAHNQWIEYRNDVKVRCASGQCTTFLDTSCKL
jgi:hypothetical protein